MAEPKPDQARYAGQPGLFSPDDVARRPITDHLAEAKRFERMKLGMIDKGGVQKFATLGDAERSLHIWWEDFTAEVLSTATESDLSDLGRIEDMVNRSSDPRELLTGLVLALPRRGSEELERRLDLSEKIAEKISEVSPGATGQYAEHQAQRAREDALGIKSPRTTQEGLREVIRQGRELLGYERKSRSAKKSA